MTDRERLAELIGEALTDWTTAERTLINNQGDESDLTAHTKVYHERYEEIWRLFEQLIPPVGPTGEYPEGQYTDQDEGELTIAVIPDPRNGQLVINFGKLVSWLALGPDLAEYFGQALITRARLLRGEQLEMPEDGKE